MKIFMKNLQKQRKIRILNFSIWEKIVYTWKDRRLSSGYYFSLIIMVITASADYYKFQNCCFDIVLFKAQKGISVWKRLLHLNFCVVKKSAILQFNISPIYRIRCRLICPQKYISHSCQTPLMARKNSKQLPNPMDNPQFIGHSVTGNPQPVAGC